MNNVLPPNTVTPEWAALGHDRFTAHWLANGDRQPFIVSYEPEESDNRAIATVHKAWGAAPYVGRPFVYMWKIAVVSGEQVQSGPAELRYTQSDAEWSLWS